MKNENRRKWLGVCLLVAVLTLANYENAPEPGHGEPQTLPQHASDAPIYIDNWTNLTAFFDGAGSGTEEDPYRIENLVINATGTEAPGIEIIRIYANAYILIQNVTTFGGAQGITLSNAENIEIQHCHIYGVEIGIGIANRVENVLIANNTIHDNSFRGITIADSQMTAQYKTIVNNTFFNHFNEDRAVFMGRTYNTIFANNTIYNNYRGFDLYDGVNCIIANNTMHNSSVPSTITLNTSTIYGNYFDKGVQAGAGNQWYNNGIGNYYGNYLEQNPTAAHDGNIWDTPFALGGTEDLYPLVDKHPVAWFNEPEPQSLSATPEANMSFYLIPSAAPIDSVWVSDPRFATDGLKVYQQVSLNVGEHSFYVFVNDTRGNAIFAEITLTITDNTPPTWTLEPENQILATGEGLAYEIEATDNYMLDSYWLNDTSTFEIFTSETQVLILNVTDLDILQTYHLKVFANDTGGNIITANMSVTMIDTIYPEWVIVPEGNITLESWDVHNVSITIEPNENIMWEILAIDNIAIDSIWIDNVSRDLFWLEEVQWFRLFSSDDTYYIMNTEPLNFDTLNSPPSTWRRTLHIFIKANDTSGNTIEYIIELIVEDSLEESIDNFNNTSGDFGRLSAFLGGAAAAVGTIYAIMYLMKRKQMGVEDTPLDMSSIDPNDPEFYSDL